MTTGDTAAVAPSDTTEGARLRGHLKLPGATALAITIVVGSGALVSPGIAYRQAGNAALYAWVLAAAVTVPLLIVFARLGARYPGAGGVAGFVQMAFGRHSAAGVELLTIGTFGLGIPSIALTGAGYLTVLPGLSGIPIPLAAAVLLAVAAAIVFAGVRLSTGVQIALAIVLTTGLLAVGVLALAHTSPAGHLPPASASAVVTGAGAIGVVYFAFTGWEMLSFTTEEYVHPRRDFPRVVVISFLIVTAMYLMLALGVQSLLSAHAATTDSAPIQAIVTRIGSPAAGGVVALLGVVIILANLAGAIWGASRLVMSSAREGLLPRPLARISGGGNPRIAVLACAAVFFVVIASSVRGWATLGGLLSVAGKNFFLLYLLCALAYARLFTGWRRVLGLLVAGVLAVVAAVSFGGGQLAYAAVLTAVGAGVSYWRGRRSERRLRGGAAEMAEGDM
ncbi:APC family permease [Nocardia vaccinii]|uniref:APC family permease n=1 Tax=Nocardia vaccinii TaxID=1822 RepID=UPI00083104B4|nr:amino acid permease [Nocardia vaccinii]